MATTPINNPSPEQFMIAYVKAARFYDDALKDGHIAGPGADEVIKILTQYSFIKDPEVHRSIVSQAIDPNGDVNMPSLQMAWKFFFDTKPGQPVASCSFSTSLARSPAFPLPASKCAANNANADLPEPYGPVSVHARLGDSPRRLRRRHYSRI